MKSSFSLVRDREHGNRGHRQGHRQTATSIQHHQQGQQRQQPKKRAPENFDNLIPRNSIQNQFSLLSNQRDNFDREKETAERELQQVQRDHQSIKNQNDAIFEANRRAKQELGQKMEKLAMLKTEESRLKRLVENEFKAIQDCTKHSKVLEQRKVETTKKQSADIDPLNFEIAALLEHRIQKKTERYITLRSVQAVVVPKLASALRNKNQPELSNRRKDLCESIELLKSVSRQHQKCVAHLGKLRAAQRRHPDTGGPTNSALQDDTNAQRNHVELFYGRSDSDELATFHD